MSFRFDANRHEYIDTERGEVLPHITGMLEATGWIDDRWYTEESRERGSAVHRLTADFDLGALDPSRCNSTYRPYLLGHVKAMSIAMPFWLHVEEPMVSAAEGFGGRPDRVGTLYGAQAILEVKTGGVEDAHEIQTALQAILVAPELRLPAESIQRYALYLKPDGKFRLEWHKRPANFVEAWKIIRETCRRAA